MIWIYLFAAAAVLGALPLLLRRMGLGYLKFRGTMLVACPETGEAASVRVDTKHAAMTAAFSDPHLQLKQCSRWPERRDCGQQCLKQIEAAPEDCLLRTILSRWYQGKTCIYCGKPLGEIQWLEHKPALLSPERKTVEWHELCPESVPGVLVTHRPVCWNCHIAETFRQRFPELVVDRPWRGPVASRKG